MRYRSQLALGILFGLALNLATAFAEEADSPAPGFDPGVPELKVLDRFVGRWTAEFGGSGTNVASTRRWVMNGKFIRHDFELSTGDVRGVIYRGYDQNTEEYTLTMIDSSGSVSLLSGHWDKNLRTLRFEAVDTSCHISLYESYFPDEMTEEWRIVVNNENRTDLRGIARKQLD